MGTWFQARRKARRLKARAAKAALRPARYRLEVNGEVPAEVLRQAQEAVALINRASDPNESSVASLELMTAIDAVRAEGHEARLVST